MQASHKLAEAMYQQAGAADAAGAGPAEAGDGGNGSPDASKDEDVIDAEYVDVESDKGN